MKPFSIATLLITLSILLSGCSQIVGSTTAEPIKSHPGKRTIGASINDEVIEIKSLVNISKADPAFEQAHINVISYNGIALIVGQVPNDQLRQLAANTVKAVRDVRRVHNELTITGTNGLLTRTNDSWITTKLKAKMLADGTIEGKRIKVVTENGVVYLMGLVTRAEGSRATESARTIRGVQKVVRLFEYI